MFLIVINYIRLWSFVCGSLDIFESSPNICMNSEKYRNLVKNDDIIMLGNVHIKAVLAFSAIIWQKIYHHLPIAYITVKVKSWRSILNWSFSRKLIISRRVIRRKGILYSIVYTNITVSKDAIWGSILTSINRYILLIKYNSKMILMSGWSFKSHMHSSNDTYQ